MRIALFISKLGGYGGTTFVQSVGKFLQSAGHSVAVVVCEKNIWSQQLEAIGLYCIALEIRSWESRVMHVHRLAAHFTRQKYDVVFLNIGGGGGVWPAQAGLHLWPDSITAVPILHNDATHIYESARLNADFWNVVIAVSPKVLQLAIDMIPNKPVRWIAYGILLPANVQLQQRIPWSLPLRLLFVGRLTDQQKGIFLLPSILTACRHMDIPVQLTVIGDGPDRKQLEFLLNSQHVGNLVKMCGMMSLNEVYGAMQTHHLLLFPSNYEGFGLVLLEAQAIGCVPIASKIPGITDVAIEDEFSGRLAVAGNAQSFADQIAVMMNPEQWNAHSHAGVQRVQQLYSVEVMGKRYLDLLEQLKSGMYPLKVQRTQLACKSRPRFLWRDYIPSHILSWGRYIKKLSKDR
ncbi:MAG: glycosyltransferase family 4 protein [Deltaproteobacteria bacterium]|jgi:glycosyltransferase involved in cell wall biosynthesis